MQPSEADLAAAARLTGASAEQFRPFDMVKSIMAYEDGSLGQDDMLRLFSHLVRTGQAWTLQGHYGRRAQSLIEAGALAPDGTILHPLGLGD